MNSRATTAAIGLAAVLLSSSIVVAQQRRLTTLPESGAHWESCEEMHDYYVRRFEASPGFGPSRMYGSLMIDRSGVFDLGKASYQIVRLDLVGLMDVKKPVVYSPDWHSGARKDIRQRDLTKFEGEAIAGFTKGTDIRMSRDDKAGTLTCAGVLRAKDTCVQCHQSKKTGDLLGAFSYVLNRTEK